MSHVPDYFARWRVRNRLTIEEAAERLFISVKDAHKIEAGRRVSKDVARRVNLRLGYRAALCSKSQSGGDSN